MVQNKILPSDFPQIPAQHDVCLLLWVLSQSSPNDRWDETPHCSEGQMPKKFSGRNWKINCYSFDDEIPGSPQPMPSPDPPMSEDESPMEDVDVGVVDNNFIPGRVHSRSPTVQEASSRQQSKRARVEEVADEDAPQVGRYTQEYPGRVADTLGTEKTKFEKIRDEQKMDGMEPHAPFADEEEWELVKWLMKNVGQTKADDFLKLPIVSDGEGEYDRMTDCD